MASFMEDLWQAIFTSGPTPTLILATNITFAALQVLLAVLLAATYSIHFVILSVLCAGLWWSINWFANELKAAQAKEEEAERLRRKRRLGEKAERDGTEEHADDEGEETEVEGEKEATGAGAVDSSSGLGSEGQVLKERNEKSEEVRQALQASGQAGQGKTTATGLQPPTGGTTRQRPMSGDLSSEISTDSEWEKISNTSER